jgi:hypothetical protein
MDGFNLQWTEKMLNSIERMAAAAFSIEEIAEVLEIDYWKVKIMYAERSSHFYKAYRKGFLARELEVRERIFKDARNGSSPAQAQAIKLLEQAKISAFLS